MNELLTNSEKDKNHLIEMSQLVFVHKTTLECKKKEKNLYKKHL